MNERKILGAAARCPWDTGGTNRGLPTGVTGMCQTGLVVRGSSGSPGRLGKVSGGL